MPIESSNFDQAIKIGNVSPGIQAFEDTPPDNQGYYYLILAAGSDGSPFKVFIASRNASSAPISVQAAAASIAPPVQAPSLPPPSSTIARQTEQLIDGILATAKGDAIIITYKPARAGLRLVLYRGEHSLKSAADLLDASLVASFQDKDGSFADYPVPGIEYYYAILVQDELRAGKIDLSISHNSTESPAHIASSLRTGGFAEIAPTSRTPPLPSFLLDQSPDAEATRIPQAGGPPQIATLSQETEKAISKILSKMPPTAIPMPPLGILLPEVNSPSGGESYSLSLIVTEKLIPGDWNASIDQLQKYLSLNRSPEASARAHYYLGQALAHRGEWRDAFFEFLSARESYSVECKPWIEFLLYVLHRS